MAKDHERGTFEAEREALRSALRFSDRPSRVEGPDYSRRSSDARLRLRQPAGHPSEEMEADLLTTIAAAVEHLVISLDSLIERVDRLAEGLGALEAALASSGPRLDA